MNTEHTSTSEKLAGKKLGLMGAIILILIVLIAGISIYDSPTNRLSRQLDLGNRYLEKQNYRQAIVEFDKAIEIDPMSVDAYLGKAEAYVEMGDLQAALETLQTGYNLTGDERLKEKMNEVQVQLDQINQSEEIVQPIEETEVQDKQVYIELPFGVTDIKFMGYDFLEPHYDELLELFGISMEQDKWGTYWGSIDNPYVANSHIGAHTGLNDQDIDFTLIDSHDGYVIPLDYYIYYYDSGIPQHISFYVTNGINRDDIEKVCDLPIFPGNTYEEWCEKMGIDTIKSSIEEQQSENDLYWTPIRDSQIILSEDGWYVDYYSEGVITNGTQEGDAFGIIYLSNEVELNYHISVQFEDGIINTVWYSCRYNDE